MTKLDFHGHWIVKNLCGDGTDTKILGKMDTISMEKIRISVRNLVEFILRSGNIDNRRGRGDTKDAMAEGSRMHRKIQSAMGSNYHAEVSLKLELEEEKYILQLEGRADGIIIEENGVTIDEIKGVYFDLERLENPIFVHRAQAICYAYIYARQNALEDITVQMTYCNLDTEEIKKFSEKFEYGALGEVFFSWIALYKKWADFQYEWKKIRQASIWQLPFPFEYRKGQNKLAKDVYRTILRKKTLFIQAPTGVGKTITTIYPAVKAVGEGLGDKIFYLTAKTITGSVAKETFDLLKEHGYRGKVLTLTAKEKLCLCEEMECNPDHCEYAKGHFDRVNDAVFELLSCEDDMTREILMEHARKHKVCPFEMSLDTALWVDDIICDYNYVFDPNVQLKRFLAEGIKGDYIFLVDEAHNLVERGRDMYSASLTKEMFLHMKKIMKSYSNSVSKGLERCNQILLELKRECETYKTYEQLDHFYFALMRLAAAIDKMQQNGVVVEPQKEWNEFYFEMRHFMNMYELLDDHYVIYTQHTATGEFQVKLYCVDPSENLQRCMEKGNSTIFFSATFLPIHYYKSLLSTRTDNYAVYAETTFSREQSLITIACDVSTKYTRRTKEEYVRIANYIRMVVAAKKGNYMVFFPSYRVMREVYECCLEEGEDWSEFLIQSNAMTEREREDFLSAFEEERVKSMTAFCVMGGIFGEGIDLKGERLIGTILVGNGLPQISNERDILKTYYDKRLGTGFDYAFRYPGMNKVLQAAGRVIRTAQDVGVIVLLEERFLQREYQQLFPREWAGFQICNQKSLPKQLEVFWSSHDGKEGELSKS